MSGQQLYSKYVEANNAVGVEVDAWENLTEQDHEIWDDMADRVQRSFC